MEPRRGQKCDVNDLLQWKGRKLTRMPWGPPDKVGPVQGDDRQRLGKREVSRTLGELH